MYNKIIISLVFTLIIFSCKNNPQEAEMILNDGVKWNVNAEMMPPLEASEKLISEFVANDEAEYKALADQLKENNKLLISSCTMKGKSHDELHKWLHPYMGLVDELGKADDTNKANLVFQKIEQSFETFNQYFQ